MAGKTRGRFIAERDWPDWRKLLQEFRAVGRTLRRPDGAAGLGLRRGNQWGFGKAGTTLAPGALAAPSNVVNKDRGPAYNAGSGEATGKTIEPDWNLEDTEIAVDEWVIWERKEGKVYVSRLDCPPEV